MCSSQPLRMVATYCGRFSTSFEVFRPVAKPFSQLANPSGQVGKPLAMWRRLCPLELHGMQWNSSGYNGIPLDSKEFHWIHINSIETIRIPKDPLGFHCIQCNSIDTIGIPLDPMEFHWGSIGTNCNCNCNRSRNFNYNSPCNCNSNCN